MNLVRAAFRGSVQSAARGACILVSGALPKPSPRIASSDLVVAAFPATHSLLGSVGDPRGIKGHQQAPASWIRLPPVWNTLTSLLEFALHPDAFPEIRRRTKGAFAVVVDLIVDSDAISYLLARTRLATW